MIDIASNGVEAVEKFRHFPEKPHIILMDHRMPLKDGLETTKEIRQLSTKPRIIFISADIGIRETALDLGAVAFLVKPFIFENLIAIIRKAINRELN